MPFKYIEDTAIADIAFDIEAPNANDLFADAAMALTDSMVDPEALTSGKKCSISLEASSLEQLLFDWLAELIYLKDVQQELFSRFEVNISQSDGKASLTASTQGTSIPSVSAEHLRNDVKAITLHQFKLEEITSGFRARVVFDI